jgi:D-glycero-D-manno-heptose 1,7-bisphosphate phosphatase
MKVIFLDRDNTINDDPGYLSDPDKVRLLPNVIDGLNLLKKQNFEFIIITNQSGIGRGYFKESEMHQVNQRICELLNMADICIKDIFYCPHTDEDNCNCRKPKPGLILKALEKYPDIEIEKSWIIGDSLRDILAGEVINIKGILIHSKDQTISDYPKNLIKIVSNLKEAAEYILKYKMN